MTGYYNTRCWKNVIDRKFSLEELLLCGGDLERVNLDYFWQEIPKVKPLNIQQQSLQVYQTLVKPLQRYIDNLEIYRLWTPQIREEYHRHTIVYLILAPTKTGIWLGLSVESSLESDDVRYDRIFEIRDFARSRTENQKLIIAVEDTIDNGTQTKIKTKLRLNELCER